MQYAPYLMARAPITNNQIRLHPYEFDQDLVAFYQSHNFVVTAYSPLGRGDIITRFMILDLMKQY